MEGRGRVTLSHSEEAEAPRAVKFQEHERLITSGTPVVRGQTPSIGLWWLEVWRRAAQTKLTVGPTEAKLRSLALEWGCGTLWDTGTPKRLDGALTGGEFRSH